MKTVENRKPARLLIATALVAISCAAPAQHAPNVGKTWRVAEHNSGSYGKDVEYDVTVSDTTWKGSPAVLWTKSTGYKVVAVVDQSQARWHAVLGPDDKPVLAFDPPIGFDMPLRTGVSFGRDHTMMWKDGASTFPYRCEVGAIEKVTVRAGSFDAYRIECTSTASDDTYWFAPAVGETVKTDLRRKPHSVLGEGRQQAELVAAPH
jgi:hypothetical protein